MKRLVPSLWSLFASRAVTPMVMLCFLLLYIGIAFFSEEPLVTLMGLTRSNPPLALLLALIPLNCGFRLVMEARRFNKRRGLMTGKAGESTPQELFDETVHLSAATPLAVLQGRLEAFGYRTRLSGASLASWQGISLFPAKMLFLAALFCLFSGILISTTLRTARQVAVVEGEPFPLSPAGRDRVELISFAEQRGLFLERTLSIQVAGADGTKRVFGVYPPAFYRGYFVYPRFLGIAPLIRFTAPEVPTGFETFYILMIYPPGKEDSASIPGTAYRIVFSLAEPQGGDDPFSSGRMSLLFKILKGDEPVSSGKIPLGGEFAGNGYRLSFPDFRRMVATDLVRDHGVILIWAGTFIFCLAILVWLPVRLFFPRREMLFVEESGSVHACSRAEGRRGKHGGMFHEALDFLASDRSAGSLHVDEAQRSAPQ